MYHPVFHMQLHLSSTEWQKLLKTDSSQEVVMWRRRETALLFKTPATSSAHKDICNFTAFRCSFLLGFSPFNVFPLSSTFYVSPFFSPDHIAQLRWCVCVCDRSHATAHRSDSEGPSLPCVLFSLIYPFHLTFRTLAWNCRPISFPGHWEFSQCSWWPVLFP